MPRLFSIPSAYARVAALHLRRPSSDRVAQAAIPGQVARPLLSLGLVTIALLAIAACGGGESDPPSSSPAAAESPSSSMPLVPVTGTDFSFDAPDSIAGGPITLRFANEGDEDHELHLLRLNDGVLIHEFQQTLHQDSVDAALQMASSEVHMATLGSGETADASVNLAGGEYVLICLIESPEDEVAHALKGMAKPLTVTASP